MSSKAVGPQRWYHSWRAVARPAPDTDPADLGTAFGLDLSLNEIPSEPPPAASRRPSWVQRLTARRRAAA